MQGHNRDAESLAGSSAHYAIAGRVGYRNYFHKIAIMDYRRI